MKKRGNILKGDPPFVADSPSDRIKRYRLKQKEQGRLKREMYLTDAEHEALKLRLSEIRKSA